MATILTSILLLVSSDVIGGYNIDGNVIGDDIDGNEIGGNNIDGEIIIIII